MKLKKTKMIRSFLTCVILVLNFTACTQNTTPSSDSSDLNENQIVISEVMTFDEIVQGIAKDNDISKSQVVNQIVSDFEQNNQDNTHSISPYWATYRMISVTFTVTDSYKPTLKLYCEISEEDDVRAINRILNIGLDSTYNEVIKAFNGYVFINLKDPNTIFWIVNGDFYDEGVYSHNGQVNMGVEEPGGVNFHVSDMVPTEDNYYAPCYKDGRVSH